MTTDRESLGRRVREIWVEWAGEQMHSKPSWLEGWDNLDDGQREADMRIGEGIAAAERKRIVSLLRKVGEWAELDSLIAELTGDDHD